MKENMKEQMEENIKENTKKDLRKVIGCKFNNGIIYLAEFVYKTLYRITIDENTTSLYFNPELDLTVDPRVIEWVDVTTLQEYRNGVFYNSDEYLPSGGYGWVHHSGWWAKAGNMISFVENNRTEPQN